jgi:EAL domain-containing protein (putative c-di-GMP-specific phosphodiesterase class I)
LQAQAEGAETAEQRLILRKLGLDLFQGYRFGYPMIADAFADHLNQPDPIH